MATTRADLRTKIRTELRDWFRDKDTINEGGTFSASDTTLTVTTGTKFRAGWFIEIDSEVLKVTAVATNNLTVTRGQMGTTAADHADSSVIYIIDGWSSAELNRYIDDGVRALYPNATQDYEGKIVGKKNYLVLDTGETASSWTEADDAVAATDNTTDMVANEGCLNLGMTWSSGYGSYSRAITSFDMASYEYLNVMIYLEAKESSSNTYYLDRHDKAVEIQLGSDSSNYKSAYLSLGELSTGWNYITINLQDFDTSTGTPTTTAIDYLAVKFYYDAIKSANIASGDLKMNEWSISTFPFTKTGIQRYRLPLGVYRVNDVWIYDGKDSSDYSVNLDWDIDENTLFFRGSLSEYCPIKIFGQKKLTVPTDDTTSMDIKDEMAELLALYATIKAIEGKIQQRARFDKYSARVQNEDTSIGQLLALKQDLMARCEDLKSRYANYGRAVLTEQSWR